MKQSNDATPQPQRLRGEEIDECSREEAREDHEPARRMIVRLDIHICRYLLTEIHGSDQHVDPCNGDSTPKSPHPLLSQKKCYSDDAAPNSCSVISHELVGSKRF